MPFRPTDTADEGAKGGGVPPPPPPPFPASGFAPTGPPGSAPSASTRPGFGYFALVVGFVVVVIGVAFFFVFRSVSDANSRATAIQDTVRTANGERAGTVAASVPSATIDVGLDARQVAVGEGAVWVARYSDGSVLKVDPAANVVAATIKIGRNATGVSAGPGVWADGGVSIVRIDPVTGAVVAVPRNLGQASSVMVDEIVAGGTVWASSTESAYRLDPASGTAIAVARSDLLGPTPNLAAAPDSARGVHADSYDVVVTKLGGDGAVTELARIRGARLNGSERPPYVDGAVWFVVTDKLANTPRLVSVNDAGHVVTSDFGVRTACPGDVVGAGTNLWVRCNSRSWLHIPLGTRTKPDAAATVPAEVGTIRSAAVAADGSLWVVAQNAANASRLLRFPPPGGARR